MTTYIDTLAVEHFGHMWTDESHDLFEPYMTMQELLYKTKWDEGDTETNAAN